MRRTRRAVFLDRDGTLNRAEIRNGKAYAPRRARDFRLLPGVAQAVGRLKRAGLVLVVVTNQPDIGAGLVDLSEVEAMHRKLRARVPIDAIKVCPHTPRDGCPCRKPKPGLLRDAAREYGLDLSRSFMVGDRASDILAGGRVGCYTLFINRGYRETRGQRFHANLVVYSLAGAVRRVLSQLAGAD